MIRQEEKQREGLNPQSTTSAALSTHSNNKRTYYHNNARTNRNYSQRESSHRTQGQSESTVRRNNFKKGFICGNYGKEGHVGEE